MTRSVRTRASAALLVGWLILGGILYLSWSSVNDQAEAAKTVERTYETKDRLRHVFALLADVETGARGFLLTGREDYLQPFEQARRAVPAELQALSGTVHDAAQQQRLRQLRELSAERIRIAAENVDLRRAQGLGAAIDSVLRSRGKLVMDEVRHLLDEMLAAEDLLLAQRQHASEATARRTEIIVVLGALVLLALTVTATALLALESRRRRRTEAELREKQQDLADANARLSASIEGLERRTRQRNTLTVMSQYLQACNEPDEAYPIVAQALGQLFPGRAFGVALAAPTGQLEHVVAEGEPFRSMTPFAPGACWAVRRGAPHVAEGSAIAPHCAHRPGMGCATVCVPMTVQGKALGVLHLAGPSDAGDASCAIPDEDVSLARTAAEQVGLAVANLRLREALRQQSIRDPLTDAHNRRFLEESLERETKRAQRHRSPLGVMMLDVDHFKRFNDRFGHDAGDVVLREVAALLRRSVRESDIVCRYGGEEFAILLPDAPLEGALARAEDVRCAIARLELRHAGQALDPVTVSIGVAVRPQHGESGSELLRAADAALYEAKRAGRDRVVSAEAPVPA